jgi:hypothetical protein
MTVIKPGDPAKIAVLEVSCPYCTAVLHVSKDDCFVNLRKDVIRCPECFTTFGVDLRAKSQFPSS